MSGKQILCLCVIAISQVVILQRTHAMDRPVEITAHRGVKKFAPENTIPAIQKAIDMGLDYVEIDIRETSDGVMVLMHDSVVNTTTDGTGPVDGYSLEEIKQLDAGSKFSEEFKGTQVPTFEEVLLLMKGHIKGYLDFKAGSLEKLVRLVEKCDMVDSVIMYGDVNEALQMKELNPGIAVMPHVDNAQQIEGFLKTVELKAVETSILVSDAKNIVEEAHKHGIKVFMDILGPFDNKTGLVKALNMHVDVIQTDNADVMLKLLEKKKSSK